MSFAGFGGGEGQVGLNEVPFDLHLAGDASDPIERALAVDD